MFKLTAEEYQQILDVVLNYATRCFFRGKQGEDATEAIGEEYKKCTDEIYKALGGKIDNEI
jgi:hypothetical protein